MKQNLFLLALVVNLASCYHVYYAPNTANAPLLTQKGETRVNALYTTGDASDFDGCEVQAAYAITKNFAVMTNFFSAGKKEEVYNLSTDRYHTEKGSGSYIEFAGGYFGNLKNARKWVGEVYGGGGFGSINNEYASEDHSKVGILKFFVQPAFGFKSRGFEFALVPKISYVNWKVKENVVRSGDNLSHADELKYIDQHSDFLAFEPAVLIRFGGRDFKFQTGLSFSGQGHYPSTGALGESLNISFGISINPKPGKR
jgi:hypothetical protein